MTKRQLYDDLLRHDVGASLVEARRLLDEAMGRPSTARASPPSGSDDRRASDAP